MSKLLAYTACTHLTGLNECDSFMRLLVTHLLRAYCAQDTGFSQWVQK